MTPQERAAVVKLYEKILSYSPDQEALEAGDDKDFEAIRQALTETRRAALLEVAELHQEWRNGKHSGTFSDLLRHKLAQEG